MRFLIVLLLSVSCVSTVQATTWQVPGDAPTIQAGIDLAAVGDVVEIACGTYTEHDLILKCGITVRSATGMPDCVTIDAQQAGRVFSLTDALVDEPAILEGLTISGGLALEGGGLYAEETGDIEIRHCVFDGNQATRGYSTGGAIYRRGAGDLVIVACTFQNNLSDGSFHNASGIYRTGYGETHVEHTLFKNNQATGGACIIMTYAGESTVDYCVFWNNWGDPCSAVGGDLPLGNYEFNNCTFYANETVNGGLVCTGFGVEFLFNNCIFAHNVGLFRNGYDGSTMLSCCNEYGTTAGDWGFGLWGQEHLRGNFSADPCFCDADNGDFTLTANSYCLPGNHPWGCDDLVGAFGAGCGERDCGEPVATENATWSGVRSLFR